MEPKLPAPNLGPEQIPSMYGHNIERLPTQVTPEQGAERLHEQHENPLESAMNAAQGQAPVLPAPIAQPISVVQNTDDNTVATDDMPLVAGDDDLIEKEWVDKAKKIISETKDDPYKREHEVGKLQADYLRKRYGKELGTTE